GPDRRGRPADRTHAEVRPRRPDRPSARLPGALRAVSPATSGSGRPRPRPHRPHRRGVRRVGGRPARPGAVHPVDRDADEMSGPRGRGRWTAAVAGAFALSAAASLGLTVLYA